MQANDVIDSPSFRVATCKVDARELIDKLAQENAMLRAENQKLKDKVTELEDKIANLIQTIIQLEVKIKELEGKLAKNSQNSSKPPGSDGIKKHKTCSQRHSSGKKSGGQMGRIGTTLKQVKTPDHIIIHTPDKCENCACDLSDVEGRCVETRQVFDLPEPKIEVTEHRIESKECPCCGKTFTGSFPKDIVAHVQYGARVQGMMTYLKNQHLIPVERLSDIFYDLYGISLSNGTCWNIDKKLFNELAPFEFNLKAHLLASPVLHFDETGARCQKKLYWIHLASSELATFYGIHNKRGQVAIDAFNILPKFTGTACHDYWKPYFTYTQARHSLCNAHHFRELTYIYEQENEEWAKEMQDLLLYANKEVAEHFDEGCLPKNTKLHIEKGYAKILESGFKYHESLPLLPKGKRGKQKQRIGKNLLDRFKEKQGCILLFIYDFSVPFTNNLAENDIRMMKVKLKISGCFRTEEGGEIFCRIRSYISTARKQGVRVWDALVDAIRGHPLTPVFA